MKVSRNRTKNKPTAAVSLFVLHWNRPDECFATVEAFLKQQAELRVVVVDNNSRIENYEKLRGRLGNRAAFLRLPENKGWGGALNVVLKKWLETAVSHSYCLISAHDAQPHEGCIKLLMRAADLDERVGIACPQYPDRSIPKLTPFGGVTQRIAQQLPDGTQQTVDVPHGTLMLVRSGCLREVGLFDERYFAYGDEHELGARAARYGWKVVMVWGAVVTNPGTWTSSPLRSYFFARNSLMLVRDSFGWPAVFRALLILANTLRLFVRPTRESFAFSAKARWLAVRDYFLKRYGLPKWAK